MWTCDICGGPIERPRQGLLVADSSLRYWRIVHKGRCDTQRGGPYFQLADFAKPGGVVREMFGIASGRRLWRKIAADGVFDRLGTDQSVALYDRVFSPLASDRQPVDAGDVGLTLRFRIFKRDNYRCQLCGRSAQDGVTLEVDHKVPRAKGGSNDPSNLWTLCFDCNRGKRDTYL